MSNNVIAAIPEYALPLVHRIASEQGFITNEYRLKQTAGANHCDGFQGVIVRVTIEKNRSSTSSDQLTIVCKMPPDVVKATQQQLLPALINFQESKEIQSPDGFFEFLCYGTYANDETEDYVIVMEDLHTAGYEMWNKYESLDFEQARHKTVRR